jgi:hypothetical protein
MFYSAQANGFYSPAVHGTGIPVDAVEISPALHASLLAAQADGARIVPGPGGVPALDWPEGPTPAEALADWRAGASVSAFQAKAALFNRGLLDDAEAVVTAAGGLILLAWQTATTFERLSPAITTLAPAIGITDPLDLDELFVEAALISA